jgi:hypothetical protein
LPVLAPLMETTFSYCPLILTGKVNFQMFREFILPIIIILLIPLIGLVIFLIREERRLKENIRKYY